MSEKQNKKNILIIVHSLAGGGAEKVAAQLSQILSQHFNINIAVYDNNVVYPYDGNLICIDSEGTKSLFVKIFNNIIRIFKLRKIKKKLKIDYSISILEPANLVNVLSRVKDKVIISHHNVISLDLSSSRAPIERCFVKLLMKTLDKLADKIIGVSNFVLVDLEKNFGHPKEKLYCIYNSFSNEEIQDLSKSEIPKKFNKIFESPVITTAGRLSKQKGQLHLLNILVQIKQTQADTKLMILGAGKLKEELIDLARQLDLRVFDIENPNDNAQDILNFDVYLMGFQKNPYMYMKKATVFVFPSLYEGFGNVLIEAMACGLPIISTDCKSGPREILADNTDYNIDLKEPSFEKYGVLMPIFQPVSNHYDRWAKILVEFINNKDDIRKKYSEISPMRALEFDHSKILLKWLEVLN